MQKVSVIVPVYNVELYLKRCIDSIFKQTYKNYEVILVDDGSSDECPEICDYYAQKDSRVIVIHKNNGGLSDARNQGLKIASGEFVFFLDSDDLIAPNTLEHMVNYSNMSGADIVISTNFKIFESQFIETLNAEIKSYKVVKSQKAIEMIFCKNTRWEACGTLFKTEILRGEKFPVGRLYEDLALIPLLVLKSKTVCFIDVELYYYFMRTGSIMDNSKVKVSMDLLDICNNLISVMKKNITDKQLLNNINSGILMELFSRTILAENNYKTNKDFIKRSRNFLLKNIRCFFSNTVFGYKRKIHYAVVGIGLGRIWTFLYVIKKKYSS